MQEKAAAEAEAKSKARISELEAMLVAIKAEKAKVSTITIDEILAAEPAVKAEINEGIKKDIWY